MKEVLKLILNKRMKTLEKSAKKVIKLSDGRWGILFNENNHAKMYANFLKNAKLKPTTIHQTKYGYAFKFNDVSTIKKVWPESLIPPTYDVEKHGSVFNQWDNLKYINYIEGAGKVFLEEYIRLKGGGIHMKNLKVPYPPKAVSLGEGVPVMTTIKPDGWIMNTEIPTYKFISYIWYLTPNSGNWTLKETKGLRSMKGDKIGKFITKEVKAGKSSHR